MTRKGKTTREAILNLLYDPEIYSSLEENRKSTFRTYRKRLAENTLKTETIEELLEEFGYVAIQEKLWAR